jgi:hypothetical protein
MSESRVEKVALFDDGRFSGGGAREWSIDVTTELAALFACAHAWTLLAPRPDESTLSFSSMLAAMVAGDDRLCVWFRNHLALRGVAEHVVTRGRHVTGAKLPTHRMSTTKSFRDAEAEATRLAGDRPLDVRHFMAAYAVVENYHHEDFLRLRIDRRAWCRALAEELAGRFPAEAEEWKAYGRRAPAVLVPDYDPDLPRGADLLGVEREVEAFAMLIAGRETQLPLSIGVFGAWVSL